MTEPILSNWVIYDHPSDFPDKWVLRRWDIIRESSEPRASPICINRRHSGKDPRVCPRRSVLPASL